MSFFACYVASACQKLLVFYNFLALYYHTNTIISLPLPTILSPKVIKLIIRSSKEEEEKIPKLISPELGKNTKMDLEISMKNSGLEWN